MTAHNARERRIFATAIRETSELTEHYPAHVRSWAADKGWEMFDKACERALGIHGIAIYSEEIENDGPAMARSLYLRALAQAANDHNDFATRR